MSNEKELIEELVRLKAQNREYENIILKVKALTEKLKKINE